MIRLRLSLVAIVLGGFSALLMQWHLFYGFGVFDQRWWLWTWQTLVSTQTLPGELRYPLYWTGAAMIVLLVMALMLHGRVGSRTIAGQRRQDELHGSASWATWRDVKKAGLTGESGVVVGGWPQARKLGRNTVQRLMHDGPEHVMVFAPTRSGKGVSLVIPTLLSWQHSVLVLDIKGENHALTAGYRRSLGHRVLKFEPTAIEGSVRFNPLDEVRLDTGREISDCQSIAAMIIDPDGKGLKDYWKEAGWSWLSTMILHVLYRVRRDENRIASLADVHLFASAVASEDQDEDNFLGLLDEMVDFDHGHEHINREVARGANAIRIKAPQERSGVHSSATVPLSLYADPIVARNISDSDFRLEDLMNGPTPAALYIVVPPSDIDRLRPLIRIIMNLFLRRLTEKMEFDKGRSVPGYRHRLLLMLDEFTSIGKLEIFERALAFMAGYGLKAFLIVQDVTQLQQAYGREESIMSNCHVRVAFAPNKIETAKVVSELAGKTTVVQHKTSVSRRSGERSSVSVSASETSRPLLTPDECLRLPGISGKTPGDTLIFIAGQPPIRGKQFLYFTDREYQRRAELT